MKNKFEQRAREIYNMVDFVDFNGKINPEETAILAMCELEEEILKRMEGE